MGDTTRDVLEVDGSSSSDDIKSSEVSENIGEEGLTTVVEPF